MTAHQIYALQPHVRFYDLRTDALLMESSRLVDYTITHEVDKPATLTFTVPLSDPDSAPAMLAAAAFAGGAAVPTFAEFSLEAAGGAVDIRKMVDTVEQHIRGGELTVMDQGGDLFALLADVVVMRQNYTDCALQDVLLAPAGGIVPLHPQHYGIGSNSSLPGVAGLLRVQTGRAGWAGQHRLTFAGAVDPSVSATPTYVEVFADTVLKAVDTVMQRLGGVVIAGDTVPQGERGHGVYDTSDGPLNILDSLALR